VNARWLNSAALAAFGAVPGAGCAGDCLRVEQPAPELLVQATEGRIAGLRADCGVGGRTAEGDEVLGRLSWEHDTSQVTLASFEAESIRAQCDATVEVWLRSRVVFTVDDAVVVEAEGPSRLRDDGAIYLSIDDAVWRSPDDLPDRVANALWESPRLVVEATLRDRPRHESCALRVAVAGEGEIHGIDVSGRREVLWVGN